MSEANLESDQTQMIDEKKESNFRVLFRSFKKNKLALISLIFVCLLFLVVIFGPWLTPYDPQEADYENLLSGPSLEHLAGTDEFGKEDRKSTRLNSSHVAISYAVFCLK